MMNRIQKTIKICCYAIAFYMLVAISFTRAFAQPVHETVVGTVNQDGAWGNSMRLCSNGDFLMSGYHNWHFHICRTDPAGNVILDRAINFSPSANPTTGLWEESYDAFEDQNGNLLTIGMTPDGPHGLHDMIVASVNPAGVLNYAQAYGTNMEDKGRFFIPDGNNMLIGGETTQGDGDVYLAQVNTASGAINWSRRYDILQADDAWDGVLVNGSYVVCGTAHQGTGDFFLMQIAPGTGNVGWCRTYAMPGNADDHTTAVTPLANGGFAMCGTSGNDMLIITTDAAGNLNWARTYSNIYGYPGFERMDIMEDVHGNLVAVAATGAHAQSNGDDGIVVKTDAAGNLLWANVYSNPFSTSTWGTGFTGIAELNDCGYALTGWYLAQFSASYDHAVIKMDIDGHTGSELPAVPVVTDVTANITVTTHTPAAPNYGGIQDVTAQTTSTATNYGRSVLVNGTVQATLPISIGNDTSYCAPGSATFDAGCPGASYNWSTGATTQQVTVTNSGTYSVVVQAAGCFGYDTAVVTATLPTVTNGNVSICAGATTVIHGQTVSTPGLYTDTILGSNGCDSISNITLTVIPVQNTSGTVTICQGQSAVIHGNAQTTAGMYTQTFTGANGCDSISAITLVVNPTQSTTGTATICAGQSINIHGVSQNTPGTYTQTFTGANGCDSTSSITLSLTPAITTNGNVAICQGGSALVHGNSVNIAGTYVDTLTSAGGCDSISTITVTVTPALTHTVNVSICQGQSYFAGGASQTTSGNYVDTLTSSGGCDSILTTALNVTPAITTAGNVAICQGGSANVHGNTVTAPGTYVDTLTSSGGCDSISTITVTLTPVITNTVNVNICQGQSYFAGGANQTTSGNYVDTLTSSGGCDSILTTTLNVAPAITTTGNVAICQGGSATVHGNVVTTPGNYVDTLTSAGGCDSISTITVTITPAITNTVNVNICQGQSYFAGGANQTASGNYVDTLTSSGGCDSILTTALNVAPAITTTGNVAICQGGSATVHGNVVTTPGNYIDTLTSTGGCDSISTITVTITPAITNTINVNICQGQSYFAGGANQTTSGNYVDTLTSSGGCDSILTTTLNVAPAITTTGNVAICQGGSATVHGNIVTIPGNYVDTLTSAGGCDSISTITVTITPAITNTVNVNICQGQSYFAGGANQTTSGNYVDTLTSAGGCDSILTTALNITPAINTTGTVSICQGGSATVHGNVVTVPGNYVDTLASVAGCDSISTITVTVNPVVTDSSVVTICQGANITIHGLPQSAPGFYTDTFQTAQSCDSVSTVQLIVNPTIFNTVATSICQGDSLFLGGVWQTSAGSYFDSLQTAGGCDSVINTIVTVNPVVTGNAQVSICAGDSILLGGAYQNAQGIYVDTLQTAAGCDSIVNTTLILIQPTMGTTTASICLGDSILLGGSYRGNAGTYVDTLFGAAATGCDSLLFTSLSIITPSTGVDTVYICSDDVINIGGQPVSDAGTYPNVITGGAASGCDSIVSVTVIVLPDRVLNASASDTIICYGEVISLSVTGGDKYVWDHGENGSKVFAQPDVTTTYEVMDTTVCGDPSAYVTVEVLEQVVFYVPNIFSPNGDGNNDQFLIRQKGVEEFHLMIYSRWGEKVFETEDPLQGWDGTFKGKTLNTGVFVYKVEAKTRCADKIDQKGEIAITR